MKKIKIANRGYAQMLREINQIMVNDQITQDYEDYLSATDGDKVSAAILALATVLKGAEEEIEPKKE